MTVPAVPAVSGDRPRGAGRSAERRRPPVGVEPGQPTSAAAFLVLRRMRVPLMVLILVFAVSVLGLTLVPGADADGRPHRLGFFDAFYFMSYTATTIGFGELPYAFSDAQRLWVVICIYLTVVSWAYAIGALLALLQGRAFRQLLAHQRFQRQVHRLGEPFVLVAGYGQTGEMLVRSFDALGRRAVVLDASPERIDALDQEALRSDVPGLAADVASPHNLRIAGLEGPLCEAVLALTDNDEANLAVTMAAALLRPDLPVVTRTVSSSIGHRMQALGTAIVVNPFDRFGEHLLLALRAPASYQLMTWLEAGPGAVLPDIGRRPRLGRWVVCGYGRFGRALTADLQDAGVDVTVIEQAGPAHDLAVDDGVRVVRGDGSAPEVLQQAGLAGAVAFVSGTQNDTTNLSLAAAARRVNPGLFLIGRQNSPANAPLFEAMQLDSLLVPTELVAREAYAHLSTPLLWRFLQEMPAEGDAWAERLVQDLVGHCGEQLPALWKVRLTAAEAPALQRWLDAGVVRLGDLLRAPESPEQRLDAVALLVQKGPTSILRPGGDLVLAVGDELLLAGTTEARWSLGDTLALERAVEQLLTGERRPVGWLWRRMTGTPPADPDLLRQDAGRAPNT
ncbi:MAG: potassium channel family protein [Actinomycetota bacterium]|nr:potassium channel family protein [Actinomycetota bacterium]